VFSAQNHTSFKDSVISVIVLWWQGMVCSLWVLHDVAPSALFAGCEYFYHRTSPCGIDICPLGKMNISCQYLENYCGKASF
jgi:hypothetical protein